jgi:hypothetical protein
MSSFAVFKCIANTSISDTIFVELSAFEKQLRPALM